MNGPSTHQDSPKVPGEALRAAVKAVGPRIEIGFMHSGMAVALQAAAPAIRKQERERVREALTKVPRFDPEKDDSGSPYALGQLDPIMVEYDDGLNGDWLRRADVLAALDQEASDA